MIRIFLLSVCLLATSLTYAQDNLVFRNGTELSVKVLEVSPTQLKYRRQDNPDGPVYTMSVANILLVKYANGTKDVFGLSAQTPVSSQSTLPVSPNASTLARLRYHSGLFSRYFVGDNGEPISRSDARGLLANHHDALLSYRHGQALRKWSIATAIPAVVLVGAGAGLSSFGFRDRMPRDDAANDPIRQDHDLRDGGHNRPGVGLALAGSGVLLGVAALVLDHKATRQFRRAASRYNQHQQQPVGLRVGPSSRNLGVGMTFTF